MMLLIKAGDSLTDVKWLLLSSRSWLLLQYMVVIGTQAGVYPFTDVQWLLYLQDHGCYCNTSRCVTFHRCSVVTKYKMLVIR